MGNIRHGNRFGMRHTEEAKKKIREARKRQSEVYGEPASGSRSEEQIQTFKETSHWKGKTGRDHSKSIRSVIVINGKVIIKDSIKELTEYATLRYNLPQSFYRWSKRGIPFKWRNVSFVGTYDEYEYLRAM